MLKCAVVAAVGFALAPAVVSAAPVEPVPAESTPVDTVPGDTVPAEQGEVPEGCAWWNGEMVCVGTPPVLEPTPAEPVLAAMPEAVAAPARSTAVQPASPALAPAGAAVMVASEAPVPAPAPAGAVTLSHRVAPSVIKSAVDAAAPVALAIDGASPAPMWAVALLLGVVAALAGIAGFRRTRARS